MLAPAQFPLQIVKLVPKPFDGDDWLFETKHDGFRIVGIRDGGCKPALDATSRVPAKMQTRSS